ncbi:proline-rich protein 16-like [Scleropages formosus]|uniref:Proline rich 16 n=1 Tax=Scleropages formosus TaxID=113540 RepID=A0A0P7VMF5_SCLFO|nr:protein Largen [Scleropages formosus]XP_018613840.1 protein Largen [Scleropages formosus]XP_018613841.1 protein Largen [Scleropages formosus]KPP77189.1 proline-rich protein 16-like [Scleropages formosus]
MSGKASKEPEGVVSKVKVKRQIKIIVEDLENILGDLKDVAKELKEVVHEIDSLTSDLQLEEETTDSSKTDTLNSSSSSTTTTTTASSIDKIKLQHEDTSLRPPSLLPAVLTVLKKPRPPLPPPRLTPFRGEELGQVSGNPGKAVGTLLRNGIVPGKQINRDLCRIPKNIPEKGPGPGPDTGPGAGSIPGLAPLLRHEKNPRCSQVTRERVRFSEKVQYHGYCPDCDLQYDIQNMDLSLESEPGDTKLSPSHCCTSPRSSKVVENGGISVSHSFPPTNPPCVPHPLGPKPQKTILRKSTTTTV